ncbi:hypothetical protein [Exiguobacterium sp. s150]|uniref:hypothetical protein n=1 Tax=Exiguobacterium sp. s150 TaxID=2751221 RepID=UPI001BE92502|nr:hypothetical protein [Exiguobacterium sp. s150]
MDQSLFLFLFQLTMQSYVYWMFATLFIALVGYVAFYIWDKEAANSYRTLWRKGYYLTFAAFALFGFIVNEFPLEVAWPLAGIAILVVVLDFGVLVTPGKERPIVLEEDAENA